MQEEDRSNSHMGLLSRMRDLQRDADDVALIALDIAERRPAWIETMNLVEDEQELPLRSGEVTLSLFLELGPMIVLTGSAGLDSFRDRPVDLCQVVEACQGLRSRSNRAMRTANRRFAGRHETSFVYMGGRWTGLRSRDERACVAIGLGGDRLFAFRRDADGLMRELVVARPAFVGQSLDWRLVSRAPEGTDIFLDASRFVVNEQAARAIIRLRRTDGSTEHRLLTVANGEAMWSPPFGPTLRVMRAMRGGLILHEPSEQGILLTRLRLSALDEPLWAYYHAAMSL